MIPMIFLAISIFLAGVSTGAIEKISLVMSGIIFYKYCIHQRQLWKQEYKRKLIGLLVGFLIGIALLLCLQYRITDEAIAINFVGKEKTAVILVLESEPPTYDLSMAIYNYRLKNKWNLVGLPLALYREKLNYSKLSSINTDYYYDYLEEELKEQIDYQYPIYIAYLYNRPYMKEVLQQAMMDGNDQLIIVPVLLTESHSFQLVNEIINEVNPLQYRVKIKNSFPLWDSEALASSFIKKISQQVNLKEKNRVGILLVGENEIKNVNYSPYIKQEILFKEKIRNLLTKEGYTEAQIRVAALKEKEVQRELEKLFEYGIKEVVVMQVSSATENINTRIIIDKAIDKTDIPQNVSINFSSGWLYNDTLMVEIIKRIQLLNMQNWN